MKLPRIIAAIAAGMLATAWLAATPAAAQDEPLPLDVDPTSGPIGTTIHVAGEDCPDAHVGFALLAGTSLEDVTALVDEDFIPTGEDGAWSGELLVWDTQFLLEDDSEVDVVPGEDYFVTAVCILEPVLVAEGDEAAGPLTHVPDHVEEPEILFYEEVPFEVTDDEEHITPPPARPVLEQPVFTG
jgi:hypothetical protein